MKMKRDVNKLNPISNRHKYQLLSLYLFALWNVCIFFERSSLIIEYWNSFQDNVMLHTEFYHIAYVNSKSHKQISTFSLPYMYNLAYKTEYAGQHGRLLCILPSQKFEFVTVDWKCSKGKLTNGKSWLTPWVSYWGILQTFSLSKVF